MTKRVTCASYCREERETHFWHVEMDGDVLIAETSERSWNTKLRKHGWELLEEGRTSDGKWVYSVYKSRQGALSVRDNEKRQREMTDEQREAARQRLTEARNKRFGKNKEGDVIEKE